MRRQRKSRARVSKALHNPSADQYVVGGLMLVGLVAVVAAIAKAV